MGREGLRVDSRKENFKMPEEIGIGDEVQLLSGGPVMKVGRLWSARGQTMARCDWVEDGRRMRGSVSVASLKRTNE